VRAIEAGDGSSAGVYRRGGEAITASFRVETQAMPEPGSILLFAVGFLAIFTIIRTNTGRYGGWKRFGFNA